MRIASRTGVLIRIVMLVAAAVLLTTPLLGCVRQESLKETSEIAIEDVQSAQETEEAEETLSLTGFVVVIDAGHQGSGDSTQEPIGPGASETKARVTSGTSGVSSGTPEHEINLQVALKLQTLLVEQGAEVVMVRETADVNISNSERAAIANEAGADLFVRLHCDGSTSSDTHGFSTLVPGYNQWTSAIAEESRVAAEYVQAAAVAVTGASDLGIVERTDLSGFNWCEVPTILCEMGFMSNPEEDLRLNDPDYQDLLATGISDGISAYLGSLASAEGEAA